MVDHKKSTYVLVVFLVISLLTGVASVLKSEDIDDLCNTDNSTIFRFNGTWRCANLADSTWNISVNNVTIFNNRTENWGNMPSSQNVYVYNHTEYSVTDWSYANDTYVNKAGDTMDEGANLTIQGGVYLDNFVLDGTRSAIYGRDSFGLDARLMSVGGDNVLYFASPQNAGFRFTSANGVIVPFTIDIANKKVDLFQDATKLEFGTGSDAYQQFDGSNWIYNLTKAGDTIFQTNSGSVIIADDLEVTEGLNVSGDLNVSGTLYPEIINYTGSDTDILMVSLRNNKGSEIIQGESACSSMTTGWDASGNYGFVRTCSSAPSSYELKLNEFGGDVSTGGDLIVADNFTGNFYYGELWFNNESSGGRITTISSSMVWYNITGFDQTNGDGGSELNGFTEPQAGALVPTFSGMYNVEYSISFERATGAVSREYEVAISVNGVIQNKSISHRTIGNANDVGDADQDFKLRLTAGDIVTLMVNNRGGSEDAGVHNAVLGMDRVGD